MPKSADDQECLAATHLIVAEEDAPDLLSSEAAVDNNSDTFLNIILNYKNHQKMTFKILVARPFT